MKKRIIHFDTEKHFINKEYWHEYTSLYIKMFLNLIIITLKQIWKSYSQLLLFTDQLINISSIYSSSPSHCMAHTCKRKKKIESNWIYLLRIQNSCIHLLHYKKYLGIMDIKLLGILQLQWKLLQAY